MKKRVALYAVFGLVFYLLFLIVRMPASWFAWGLNQLSHGAVRVEPVSGGLWHGTGRLVVYYPQTVPHELGIAEWRINSFWIFAGRIEMNWRVNSQDTHLDTTVRLSSGPIQLLDTEASFPIQSLGTFYPPVALISPQGQVRVHAARLVVGDGIEGDAEILWQNAGSSLSSIQPLGDYRLEIAGSGKTANLTLSTLRGVLELAGKGQYQHSNGQIQFTGSALPRERAAELQPILKMLGEDQGDGKRLLKLTSRLPI